MILYMLENYNIRTDLALETKEKFDSDNVEIKGVSLTEDYDPVHEVTTTVVKVETERGAKIMGRPVGSYITIEAPGLTEPDEEHHSEISRVVAEQIRPLLPKIEELKVLVVGLGNRQVTPDAIGPNVVDNLFVTRHLINQYGKYVMGMEKASIISAIVPGVMGQTGMETAEIVKGVVEETKPDCIIVIDALASRSTKRLNRTIQIADTGIQPGSGVGNHRKGINKGTLGIPVIGVGVPTVVDAATIVNDTMENLITALESSDALKGVGDIFNSYNEAQKYDLIRELIAPNLNGMFVTPKNVDETVKRISYTISESLNQLFVTI